MLPHYLVKHTCQKQAINDKLQGSVATYLRCDAVVNNQIRKCLWLSLSVKIFLNCEYLAKLQAITWLSRALSSSFKCMLARCTKVVWQLVQGVVEFLVHFCSDTSHHGASALCAVPA